MKGFTHANYYNHSEKGDCNPVWKISGVKVECYQCISIRFISNVNAYKWLKMNFYSAPMFCHFYHVFPMLHFGGLVSHKRICNRRRYCITCYLFDFCSFVTVYCTCVSKLFG